MSTIEILKRCEVFLGLDNDDLQRIVDLPSCQEKSYQLLEIIFRSGEEAKYLHVLEEGRVDLVVKVPGTSPPPSQQATVCTITRGGIFGWPALVPPHVFTLSAVSRDPSKALVIGGAELRALFREYPHIGYEVTNSLLRVIASRFRYIEQLLITGKKTPLFTIPKENNEASA
ncbi:cyclic nucleotide-binding domain-containing protein [Chloroflexota bacterium]